MDYQSKCGKDYNFSKYALPIVFSRNIYERKLTLEEADTEQSKLANKLKNIGEGVKPVEKKSFLYNLGLFLGAREKNS